MNISSTQDTLTRHTAMTSTNSATTSSAAPPMVPPNGRGRERTVDIDIDVINVPKLRLRSLSPEKRDLFLPQQNPVSPTKPVYNSEFTGRTFSEREQALKDKAKGLTVKPLPKRKINEVPWLKGNPVRVIDWKIAQARGKNVRKLTEEEKSLLSPVKATTRAPLVTPPKATKVALSTTFKDLVKETQTASRSSRYGKLITNNTQGTVPTNFKSPIKETRTATRAPKHSSLSKLKAQNTREAGVQEPQSAINPSKLAVLWRASAINIQKIVERTSDDSIREPIAVISISNNNSQLKSRENNTPQTGSIVPTGTIIRSPARADSWGHTGSSVHLEHPSRLSSSMARTTSDLWSHSTSFRDTEGAAGTVCVPNPLPEDLPHYELIIWRTFARKQDARGNDITPKTRKVSFPITQDLAARIAAGQNVTFVNDFNGILEGAQDELALLIPLITGSDGILFPPEFMDIADKQFAAIVGELVKFQERGYGRWSLDSLRRRVVANDIAYASGLASHLEAVLVIRMTGFTKKGWLGLPGYDADGDLRIIPLGGSSSFNNGWSYNSPRNRIPGAGFERESGLVGVQLSHGGERPEPSLDGGVELENEVNEASMPMILSDLSKSVNETFNKRSPSPRTLPLPTVQTPDPKERSAEIRLSTSTTPFLQPKKNTQGPIGDGMGMAAWNNYAGGPPDPRIKHLATSVGASKLSPKRSTPRKKKTHFGSEPDAAPKPERATSENWSAADVADSVPFGQNVLTKAQLEAGKTYVSTRNPSNPIPGALLSPGVIDSEPTLRMVLPTPPAKPTATTKFVIHPSNISQHAGGKTAMRHKKANRSKSSQTLSGAGATEAAGSRRRWEFGTASSLAKERPASPVKSRANSPIKSQGPSRTGSPVKRSDSPAKTTAVPKGFTAAQSTAASAARVACIIKPGAKQVPGNATATVTTRPKSRAAETEGTQGTSRSRAGTATRRTGPLSRYGTATVRTFEN